MDSHIRMERRIKPLNNPNISFCINKKQCQEVKIKDINQHAISFLMPEPTLKMGQTYFIGNRIPAQITQLNGSKIVATFQNEGQAKKLEKSILKQGTGLHIKDGILHLYGILDPILIPDICYSVHNQKCRAIDLGKLKSINVLGITTIRCLLSKGLEIIQFPKEETTAFQFLQLNGIRN